MHWLVDGMNVVGSRPDGWWRNRTGARRRLVDLLGASIGGREAVTVVFDGRTEPGVVAAGESAGVAVVFAPGGPNAADDVIASMAESADHPASITVVTSDRALAERVRAAGVAVTGSAGFRSRLEKGGGAEPPS